MRRYAAVKIKKTVQCIDSTKSKYLKTGKYYHVVLEKPTTYLIRLSSGIAKEFKKTRFQQQLKLTL